MVALATVSPYTDDVTRRFPLLPLILLFLSLWSLTGFPAGVRAQEAPRVPAEPDAPAPSVPVSARLKPIAGLNGEFKWAEALAAADAALAAAREAGDLPGEACSHEWRAFLLERLGRSGEALSA